ncbi:MAG: hypothetical protein K2J78_13535 [Muribaculaceae bacterium]|nr:hypothetical protein [Muribaculaceae bacterium]
MKRFLLIGAILCCGTGLTNSQVPQSFLEFRQEILDDYQEFRRTILAHYADFLEGTWHEYESLMPAKRDETPKPIKVPNIKLSKPSTAPVKLPAPHLRPIPQQPVATQQPGGMSEPDLTSDHKNPISPLSPDVSGSLLDLPPVEVPPEAKREVPPTIKIKPEVAKPMINVSPNIPKVPVMAEGVKMLPLLPHQEEENRTGKDVVNFYGMEILVPEIDFKINKTLGNAADFARHWKLMDEQNLAERVENAIMPKIKELGLNDYLTYEFLSAYMDSKFPDAGVSPKMSAVHYLLANQGYDVRIAVTTGTGDPVILMPCEQMIYGNSYMTIGGRNYFLMAPPGVNLNGVRLATCDLPKAAKNGKTVDLRIDGLNLPMKERPFKISQGGVTLTGTLNENLMPIVYKYPQMDTQGFAVSVLDKNLRKDLVSQIKRQLGDKDKLTATNELLRFMQFGFDYATDDELHGFEKPYFLEENFYYPKNDCEDRAIFYTYMLWNALGIDNQLLAFPGHESASVSIPGASIRGTSYENNGKLYYISDPTYIGSTTGQCMRQYETTSPTIDHTYSH